MSHGEYKLEIPHFCGELIEVTVRWSIYHGSYENPPESDVEYSYNADVVKDGKCPKCGVDLEYDDLFYNNISKAEMSTTDHGEYVPGDERDYEPDLEEPEPYWSD